MAKHSDIVSRKKPKNLGLWQDLYDFSLVLGGPLYQLLRRAYLCGEALELLCRRMLVISLLAWLPLLVLSVWGGQALGGSINVPFLLDVEVHVRFLLALPLLILAELVVHERMRPEVQQFLARHLIPERARPRFEAALTSALRWRNSIVAEVLLIGLVYGVGVLIVWRHYMALGTVTWYGGAVWGAVAALAGLLGTFGDVERGHSLESLHARKTGGSRRRLADCLLMPSRIYLRRAPRTPSVVACHTHLNAGG